MHFITHIGHVDVNGTRAGERDTHWSHWTTVRNVDYCGLMMRGQQELEATSTYCHPSVRSCRMPAIWIWVISWMGNCSCSESEWPFFVFDDQIQSSPPRNYISINLIYLTSLDMVRRLAGWAPPLFNKGGPCVWTELNPEARWSLWYFHLPVALCIKTNYRRMERGNEKWDL